MNLGVIAHARTDSTKDIIRSSLLEYFSPYVNINDGEEENIENELLNTKTESKLFYPPFPRTWIERYSAQPVETTTTAIFDTSKIGQAVSTFAGPLGPGIMQVLNGYQLNYKYEHSIKYSYNKATTLMVMTSWRQFADPNQPKTDKLPFSKDTLEHEVMDLKDDLRNYYKVSKDYPLIGMCKYEMSLNIQKSDTNTFGFIFGSEAKSNNVVDGMSYTVYSNFFQIEGHIPAQDYLHVRCGENFTEAVRFLVEKEFNKMVTEAFAHYHPRSECRWTPPSNKMSKQGDQDCLNWFNKLDILGLNKKNSVPRCILGEEGYPVCVVRTAKPGAYCPIYSSRGKISAKEPKSWERQLNPMENTGSIGRKTLYQCDQGLECRLQNGKPITAIPLSDNPRERFRQLQSANYITTCQPMRTSSGR